MRKNKSWISALIVTAIATFTSYLAEAQTATIYSYDALGRLTGVRDGTGYTTDYSLDKASNRTNLKVTEQFPQFWAATSGYIGHNTGHAEAGGWAASVTDPAGHMIFGPYATNIPVGAHVAAYRMLVDNNTANNDNVLIIEVYDPQLGMALASRNLTRREWKTAGAYEVFELPFTLTSGSVGHGIEFRVYYYGSSYVRVERVGYR